MERLFAALQMVRRGNILEELQVSLCTQQPVKACASRLRFSLEDVLILFSTLPLS